MVKQVPCTRCFATLGVGSRMNIFEYLRKHGKSTVGEVVEHVKLTQPTISYHLKEMKQVGLLENERKGKQVFYQIRNSCPYRDSECVLNDIQFTSE